MKIHQFVVLLLVLGYWINAETAPALQGTWLSNAELTIKSIESKKELTDEARAAYVSMFGKMKLTFETDEVIVDHGIPAPTSTVFREHYQIRSSGTDYVVVEFGRSATKTEKAKYIFDDNCIKRKQVNAEWFEYFCKIK